MSGKKKLYLIEILHQTTTEALVIVIGWKLYLIEILHQTTTLLLPCSVLRGCILSKFYIKPQQTSYHCLVCRRCILSKFYIKPQRHNPRRYGTSVVSYRNSTSNHNILILRSGSIMLYLIEILHQTTTSPAASLPAVCCILSKFYIKPQLTVESDWTAVSCILSKFYIKPQRRKSL